MEGGEGASRHWEILFLWSRIEGGEGASRHWEILFLWSIVGGGEGASRHWEILFLWSIIRGGEGASRHWEILFYVSRSVFPLSFLVISPQTWLKFGIMVMPSLEQNDQKFLSSCQKPLYLTMSVGLSFLYLSYLAGRLSRWYMLSITNFF